jgi:Fe-S oxidoreductase
VMLMLTDMGIDSARRALTISPGAWSAPVASVLAQFLNSSSAPGVYRWSLWAHCLLILGFLNYLPFGKHFHIITSFPNVFFSRLGPHGRTEPIHDLESTMEKAMESGGGLGVRQVEDQSWKMILDSFSCTECGRCVPQCPAWATGKPLSLRDVNISTRKHLMAKFGVLGGKLPPAGSPDAWDGQPLTGGAIAEETVWSCTMCRDCEERCPVLIEILPRIVEMRRHLNMMESSFPPELNKLFTAIERQSNPWGISQADRGKWLEGTEIRRMADDPNVEYLFFVGCMGSYDARSIKTSLALAAILQSAGIRFGVLAEEECCNGETVRRLGNEYLAQSLIQANVETFERYKVRKIVTNCPHCFNTLRNEYPDFGGCYQVEHAVDLVARLLTEKRIRLQPGSSLPVAFHDPCFLGRYNAVFSQPRSLIHDSGALLREPSLSQRQSFCCGAGGGRMWIEEHEPRVNTARFDEIYSSCRQPSTIAVACPFCRTMLSDASKSRGKDEEVQVKDVVELVAERLA